MSGFFETRFPEGISYGSTGGPQFRTTVETRGGGGEKRVKEWPSPLWRFDARKGVADEAGFFELLSFFLAIGQGRLNGFRYKDPTDFQAVNQALDTSAGNGVYTLRKAYTFGGFSFHRRITKPVNGTLAVTLNGSPVVVQDAASGVIVGGEFDGHVFDEELFGGATATVVMDYTTGILNWYSSPVPAPTDDLRATFEFDVPARFDVDYLETTYANFRTYQIAVPIIELRRG